MTLDDVFGPEGLLQKSLQGFSERHAQQAMAKAIQTAIAEHHHLVVEAGTGTGKTLAYLVPVFLTEKKAVLSTGTRNLQDQLFGRDIPLVKAMLASPRRVALLKGRSNYLCHYRLHQLEVGERLVSRDEVRQIPIVSQWKSITRTGDVSELADIPEEAPLWREVTSTIDNCLGQECPFIKDCFVLKARRTAMAADVVVVNHHLFLSDLALQEEGLGELLPDADVVVFDEAHELPELLSQFFSTRLSARHLQDLARDITAEVMSACPELPEFFEETRALQTGSRTLRLALGIENRRALWPEPLTIPVKEAIVALQTVLMGLMGLLEPVIARSKGLESVFQRTKKLAAQLDSLSVPAETKQVRWFETSPHSFSLYVTPLVVADALRPFLQSPQKTRIFTSATLTVANSFQEFVRNLGLEMATQLQLDSPFNYAEQALLYVPRGLPDPRKPDYTDRLMAAALPLLQLTNGRAFLLFTSYRALEQAADYLDKNTDYLLLVQGTLPKKILLDQFLTLPRSLLLGTASFWQGVDVRGDALILVVIDRLPFASPDDPVLQARLQKMRAEGLDPFKAGQLAEAILTLRQGAGRLIRDSNDRGILMIGDPRLVGARYGQSFLHSLPPMPRTRDIDKVKTFLSQIV